MSRLSDSDRAMVKLFLVLAISVISGLALLSGGK